MTTPTSEAIEAAARALAAIAGDEWTFDPPSKEMREGYSPDYYRRRATAALSAAAPFIQAEERDRVIQAVHDAAELEPEERDGPHLLVEASLWITVGQLNNLHGIQDGMDWVRYTATDYANQIAQAKAEALAEVAESMLTNDPLDYWSQHLPEGLGFQEAMSKWLLATAATIEGGSE